MNPINKTFWLRSFGLHDNFSSSCILVTGRPWTGRPYSCHKDLAEHGVIIVAVI